MEDILDYKEPTIKPSKLFSIVGFGFAILTIILYALFWVTVKNCDTYVIYHPTTFSPFYSLLLYIAYFLGLSCSIIGMFRGEEIKKIKTFGLILNFLLALPVAAFSHIINEFASI